MKLGKVLKDYRYANKLGVRELGKEIGISTATVSRIENGKPPDFWTLKKIFNWLFGL